MHEIIQQTPTVEVVKNHFLDTVRQVMPEHPRVSFYPEHVKMVEKWALHLLHDHPDADREIVLLGVWLHDIGNMIGEREIDHAIRSEAETRRLLIELGLDQDKVEKVAHCTRAHRNKDVPPQTLEAKIVAAADSASHMTGDAYTASAGRGDVLGSLAKLERDFRDIGLIPHLQEELTPLYEKWKELLEAFPVNI